MAGSEKSDITDVVSVPLGEVIASVAQGVADAQRALDAQVLATARQLADGGEDFEDLRALGYQPTWYRIPEAEAELTVSLSLSARGDAAGGGAAGHKVYTAPVDAEYLNRYEYDLRAASRVKFKVVPVPPAPGAEGLRFVPADLLSKGGAYGDVVRRLDKLGIDHEVATSRPSGAGHEADRVVAAVPPEGGVLTRDQPVLLRLEAADSGGDRGR